MTPRLKVARRGTVTGMSHSRRDFFAYVRVSTTKQGQGVSLQEQRAAIERYAEKEHLVIGRWFEEQETAAKRGRPVFSAMLRALRKGEAAGVVIHKIDRSARNLRDWADIGELIDQGVEVRFANEPLDLTSRGGRLSADILAVVAADFIRNNREETRKGFYGRLKQGLYPLNAPLGYLDQGSGKPKAVDPIRGPLVKRIFELYATGRHNFHDLLSAACELGLWNKNGRPLSQTAISTILNNPFYAGVIRLRSGETFQGVHEPLVSASLFGRVQTVLQKRTMARHTTHEYRFRRLFACATCGYSLIASRHKGHVYYRCQTRTCPTTSVREEALAEAVERTLGEIRFTPEEIATLERLLPEEQVVQVEVERAQTKAIRQILQFTKARIARFVDLYVAGGFDRQEYDTYRSREEANRRRLEAVLRELQTNGRSTFVGLPSAPPTLASPAALYSLASDDLRRELLQLLTEERKVERREITIRVRENVTSNDHAARQIVRLAVGVWNANATLPSQLTAA